MGQLFFLKTPWCWKHVETEIVICREMIGLGNLLPNPKKPRLDVMGDLRLQRETIERSRDNMGKAIGSKDGWGYRWVKLADNGPKEGSAEPEFCYKKMRVQ